MLLRIEVCDVCASALRKILAKSGKVAMARAVGKIVQACPTCGPLLPPIDGRLVTGLKTDPGHYWN